jgi:hypothetical protein
VIFCSVSKNVVICFIFGRLGVQKSQLRDRLLWLRSVILFSLSRKIAVYRVFILSDKYRLIFPAVLSYPIQLTAQSCGGIAAGGDIGYLSDKIMTL